jgi:hypothetical protein
MEKVERETTGGLVAALDTEGTKLHVEFYTVW